MENKKTEKKRIFSKLTVCVAALALVSCAFVGGTFARYTTGKQTTPGGVNVADWNIEIINEGEGFLELAPNMQAYDDKTGTEIRSYEIAGGKVLEIHNNGQVAGMFKLAVNTDSYVLEDKEGNPIELPAYSAELNNPEWEGVTIDQIFALDALTVTKNNNTTLTATTDPSGISNYEAELAPGEYVIVEIAGVTWTSDLTSDNLSVTLGTYGDLRDTWLGENVSMVGYAMNWSVDQAKNVPEGGTPLPTP